MARRPMFSDRIRRDILKERNHTAQEMQQFFPDTLDEMMAAIARMSDVHENCHATIDAVEHILTLAEQDESLPRESLGTLENTLFFERVRHLAVSDLHNRMLEVAMAMDTAAQEEADGA